MFAQVITLTRQRESRTTAFHQQILRQAFRFAIMLRIRSKETQPPFVRKQTLPPLAVVTSQTRCGLCDHRSYRDHGFAIGWDPEKVSRHNRCLIGSMDNYFEALRRAAAQMIGVIVAMLQYSDERTTLAGRMRTKRVGKIKSVPILNIVVAVMWVPVRIGAAIVPNGCEIAG